MCILKKLQVFLFILMIFSLMEVRRKGMERMECGYFFFLSVAWGKTKRMIMTLYFVSCVFKYSTPDQGFFSFKWRFHIECCVCETCILMNMCKLFSIVISTYENAVNFDYNLIQHFFLVFILDLIATNVDGTLVLFLICYILSVEFGSEIISKYPSISSDV